MTVDELHGVLKDELKGLRGDLDAKLKAEGEKLRRYVDRKLKAEGETTRRHFNVVAERIESHVKLVAEVNSHHAAVLGDHETRLQKIEKHS